MSQMSKPGNKNFVIAALVIFLGIAFSIGFFIFTLTGINDNSHKFVAPSQTTMYAEEGKYTVYYEYKTEFEGERYSTSDADINGLKLIVIDKGTNKLIEVNEPIGTSTYTVNGSHGTAIYTFEILEDTEISIESISESNQNVILNINGGMAGPVMIGVFVLLFGISFSIVAGVIIILLQVSKISKYNKEMLAQQQKEERESEAETSAETIIGDGLNAEDTNLEVVEREEVHESVKKMWSNYLTENNIDGSELEYEAWAFGSDESIAKELADLVLQGKKQGTTSLHNLYELEKEALPQVGELSVITQWDGSAVCVIETTGVTIKAFKDVDENFAMKEGEGDGSLYFWKKVHVEAFSKELKDFELEFNEDLLVVCETFKVVYK